MAHIERIRLQNYRSFMEAECRLSPLTLVVGRNNMGKSNFLRAFRSHAEHCFDPSKSTLASSSHYQKRAGSVTPTVSIELQTNGGDKELALAPGSEHSPGHFGRFIPSIFALDPAKIGGIEEPDSNVLPHVEPDGKGVTAVLRMLMQGSLALRKRFAEIETQFRQCLPEIQTLHLPEKGPSQLMVEQDGIPDSLPVSDLSDGARLILGILSLVHQHEPPPLVLLEDLDHRIHPRLFEPLVRFLDDLIRKGAVGQIIVTTHNPYLVDEFIDTPEAVVIVEKQKGRSTLVNMDERLAQFMTDDQIDQLPDGNLPLGQILFSGLADAPPPARLPAAVAS